MVYLMRLACSSVRCVRISLASSSWLWRSRSDTNTPPRISSKNAHRSCQSSNSCSRGADAAPTASTTPLVCCFPIVVTLPGGRVESGTGVSMEEGAVGVGGVAIGKSVAGGGAGGRVPVVSSAFSLSEAAAAAGKDGGRESVLESGDGSTSSASPDTVIDNASPDNASDSPDEHSNSLSEYSPL